MNTREPVKITPLRDYVLVTEHEMRSGAAIIIPDSVDKPFRAYRVLGVGDQIPDVSKGDVVYVNGPGLICGDNPKRWLIKGEQIAAKFDVHADIQAVAS